VVIVLIRQHGGTGIHTKRSRVESPKDCSCCKHVPYESLAKSQTIDHHPIADFNSSTADGPQGQIPAFGAGTSIRTWRLETCTPVNQDDRNGTLHFLISRRQGPRNDGGQGYCAVVAKRGSSSRSPLQPCSGMDNNVPKCLSSDVRSDTMKGLLRAEEKAG